MLAKQQRRLVPGGALLAAALALAPRAQSREPPPAGTDVPIFTISKSENRNQVEYGIRLDADCRPIDAAPLVAGWRMIERGPHAHEPLLDRELPAYGIARQAVVAADDGAVVRFALRALPTRTISVHTWRSGDRCLARAELAIAGTGAQLFNVHAQLAWPFGVDRLIVSGWSLADRSVVRETVRP